jgi:hypothetical protein
MHAVMVELQSALFKAAAIRPTDHFTGQTAFPSPQAPQAFP